MVRRTLSLPDRIEALVRAAASEGESFSAAAARLIEEGAKRRGVRKRPLYIASGEGPRDLGRLAEHYLRETVRSS